MMLGDLGHLELAARRGRQPRGGGSTRAAALHFRAAASGTKDDLTRIGNEEHAREGGCVDHRGSEVGLDEDEKHRARREGDRGENRLAVADPLRAIGE